MNIRPMPHLDLINDLPAGRPAALSTKTQAPPRERRKLKSEGAQDDGAIYESPEFNNFRAARIKVEIERRCLIASAL
jgi:hypothetical protein